MILIGSRAAFINNNTLRAPTNNSDWDLISSEDEVIALLTQHFKYIQHFHEHAIYNKYNIVINYLQVEYNLEIELIEPESSSYLIAQYCSDLYQESILFDQIKVKVPPLELLYLIKKSHLHIDINWSKHIKDYHALKSQLKLDPLTNQLLQSIYQLRVKETNNRNKQPNINLNVDNEDFFNDKVTRIIEHDKIHEYVKYG